MGFNAAYEGTPPWDIGGPQPEVLRWVSEGWLKGRVLDVGCGTGENALEIARRGNEVWGVDAAPNAIRRAQAKVRERGTPVHFAQADALALGRLGVRFDAVLDCGLFHVFPDEERAAYVRSLGQVVRDGGRYHMLVFSDAEPTDWGGPRRIAESEIRSSFRTGWSVEELRPGRFASNMPGVTGYAWAARILRAAPAD